MNAVAEYPMHKAAKTSLRIAGVLMCLPVMTAPIGIYFLYRIGRAKVTITPTGVTAAGVTSASFVFADVARFGLLKIPIAGNKGVAGALAQSKLGGLDYGLNVVVQTRAGKNIKFVTNQFERHEDMIARITQAISVPCEELTMGALSWKWPAR